MVNRILGEKIREPALKMPVIPVTYLPKGVYYLMIRQARGAVFSEKVVVQR
jgi:hypothetical protein